MRSILSNLHAVVPQTFMHFAASKAIMMSHHPVCKNSSSRTFTHSNILCFCQIHHPMTERQVTFAGNWKISNTPHFHTMRAHKFGSWKWSKNKSCRLMLYSSNFLQFLGSHACNAAATCDFLDLIIRERKEHKNCFAILPSPNFEGTEIWHYMRQSTTMSGTFGSIYLQKIIYMHTHGPYQNPVVFNSLVETEWMQRRFVSESAQLPWRFFANSFLRRML